MRRFLSFVLLIITIASQAEAVVGAVRDGEVHHESTAEAWVHAQDPHGPHAHDNDEHAGEQKSAAAEHDESRHEDHEHGTQADHCSHLHGAALVGHAPLAFETTDGVTFDFEAPTGLLDTPSDILSPPPQA